MTNRLRRSLLAFPPNIQAITAKQHQIRNSYVDDAVGTLESSLNSFASGSLFTWTTLNTGSQFEMTRIFEANERDVMFICFIKDVVVESSNYAGFYRLRCLTVPQEIETLTSTNSDGTFLDPKLFLLHFRALVNKTNGYNYCNGNTQPGTLEVDKVQKETAPGVKATITAPRSNADPNSTILIDIDLTPAVEVTGWPDDARTVRPEWVPEKAWDVTRAKYHLIPKCHYTEQAQDPGKCTLWRVSFSYAEKTLLEAAGPPRTDLVKQLKIDLRRWHEEPGYDDLPDMSSYVMKMTTLHMFDAHIDNDLWSEDDKSAVARARHIDALRFVHSCFTSDGGNREPFLPHYFLPRCNVIDNLLRLAGGRDQCHAVVRLCLEHISLL